MDVHRGRIMNAVTNAIQDKHPAVFRILVFAALFANLDGPYGSGGSLVMMAIVVFTGLALLADNPRVGVTLWGIGTALLVWTLIRGYEGYANHGFILIYFAVLITITWNVTDKEEYWRYTSNFCFFMLALLMGVALLHKLASSYYMSGDLLGHFLIQGNIYGNLSTSFVPEFSEFSRQAADLRAELREDYALSQGAAVAFTVASPTMYILAMVMTYTSLAMQALVELAILMRQRIGIYLHYIIFVFVLMVYSLRHENVFLSLNCIMGYALTDERSARMRVPYVILIGWLLVSYIFSIRPLMFR
ncbi:MAG: hypothetical protein AAFR79_01205 [Pseudomonadota bacterium]